uniref:Secreted protein n=1 Tax=Mesocestoides corti TaxID=53468 RepID=A0A5K3FMJ8_MESCO
MLMTPALASAGNSSGVDAIPTETTLKHSKSVKRSVRRIEDTVKLPRATQDPYFADILHTAVTSE